MKKLPPPKGIVSMQVNVTVGVEDHPLAFLGMMFWWLARLFGVRFSSKMRPPSIEPVTDENRDAVVADLMTDPQFGHLLDKLLNSDTPDGDDENDEPWKKKGGPNA